MPQTYAPGDIVIMTHPTFDRHCVAEIVSLTLASVNVHYITERGIKPETKLRKKNAVIGKLPEGVNPLEVAADLTSAYKIRMCEEKVVQDHYLHDIMCYIAKEA